MFPLFKRNEPAKVRFVFDGVHVIWQDIKIIGRIQEQKASPEDIQTLMSHFMVDEKGDWMDEDKAVRLLDRLKQDEIKEVTTKFMEALQEASIPKANGNGSSLPSDPGPAETFPNGSTS